MKVGVSPRRLSGWEPTTRTTFRYGPDGALVGSESVADPEWSELDLALVETLESWRRGLCPGCGRPYADHKNMKPGDYPTGSRYCPAVDSIDQWEAKKRGALKHDKSGRDPMRAQFPLALTRGEWMAVAEQQKHQP